MLIGDQLLGNAMKASMRLVNTIGKTYNWKAVCHPRFNIIAIVSPAIVESIGVLVIINPIVPDCLSSATFSPIIVIIMGVTIAAPNPLRL